MSTILDTNDLLFKSFEPKTQNRFQFGWDGAMKWQVKTASGFGFDDEEVKMDFINTYKKIRGKRTWNDISLTMYDPIKSSSVSELMDWARLGYEYVTGRAGYSDFYKKDATLRVLGPVGDVVSEWIVKGAWIKTLNQGEFNYSSSEIVEVSVTLAVDGLILNY